MVNMLDAEDSLLPPMLAEDENMVALATVAARLQAQRVNVVAIYDVDNVDSKIMPYLAEQNNVLGVKGWQFCRNDDERRTLLKTARELNLYKGTAWAIEEVLRVFSAGGIVKEWFEYEGEPYHFRVDVELYERGITETEYAYTVDIINAYKNVRSVLDGIIFYITSTAEIAMAATLHSSETVSIYPMSSV